VHHLHCRKLEPPRGKATFVDRLGQRTPLLAAMDLEDDEHVSFRHILLTAHLQLLRLI
jgi:hypothetical protein